MLVCPGHLSLVMSEKGLLTNLAAVYLCFILFMSAVCINFLQLCNYLLTRNLFGNNWYRRINYYLQYSLYSRKSRSQYFINCLTFSSTFEVTTEKLISTFSNCSTLFNFLKCKFIFVFRICCNFWVVVRFPHGRLFSRRTEQAKLLERTQFNHCQPLLRMRCHHALDGDRQIWHSRQRQEFRQEVTQICSCRRQVFKLNF